MKIDPHRLGRRIRAARRARGLTQTQLAALLGISVTHLSHIENDRAGASLEILVRLMELLDLTPNRLFCGTEDPLTQTGTKRARMPSTAFRRSASRSFTVICSRSWNSKSPTAFAAGSAAWKRKAVRRGRPVRSTQSRHRRSDSGAAGSRPPAVYFSLPRACRRCLLRRVKKGIFCVIMTIAF